jgi:large subunit ribosomal protein L25
MSTHDTPTLEVAKRDRIGTRYARRLREAGMLPAVVYGHGEAPVHVAADAKAAYETLKQGHQLINIQLDGDPQPCLVKDIQFDYLGDTVIHLDLARVNLKEDVEVEVGLKYEGEPAGINEPGAMVQHPHTEVLVACKANNIPDEIVVDLGTLTIDEPIQAGDLAMPEGVKLVSEPQMAVATMSIVQARDEDDDDAAEAGDAEPEVIGKTEDGDSPDAESTDD